MSVVMIILPMNINLLSLSMNTRRNISVKIIKSTIIKHINMNISTTISMNTSMSINTRNMSISMSIPQHVLMVILILKSTNIMNTNMMITVMSTITMIHIIMKTSMESFFTFLPMRWVH